MPQSFFIALGKLMALLLSFVMPLCLTRFLTPNDYGIYSQFYTFLFFIVPIFSCGIPSSLYFYYRAESDEYSKSSIVANNFFAVFTITILGSLVLLIPTVNQFILGENLKSYTYYLILCVVLLVPTNMLEPLYILRNNKWLMAFYPSIVALIRVGMVITSAIVFKTIDAILISVCLVHIILFLFTVPYIFKKEKISINLFKYVEYDILKKQISYGLPFGLAIIVMTLSKSFDKIMCISYLSPTEYAIYAVSFFGIPGIMQIYDSLSVVNVVNMTNFYQKGDYQNIVCTYKEFVIKTVSFATPIILIVCVFAEQIICFIFTDKYLAAVPLFQIYIFSFIVNMLGAGTILRAMGKTKYTFRAQLFASILTIPITYFLIKTYGMYGALAGAMIAILVPKIFQIYFEINILKCTILTYFPWKNFVKILFICGFCLMPFVYIQTHLTINIFLALILSFIYIVLSYSLEIVFSTFIVNKQQLVSFVKKMNDAR